MLDVMNAIACAIMLMLTLPIAVVMSHRGFWLERIVFSCIVLELAVETVGPFSDFVPPANWLQTISNLVVLCIALLWRREAMMIVRWRVGPVEEEQNHPTRRASDLSMHNASHASGGIAQK